MFKKFISNKFIAKVPTKFLDPEYYLCELYPKAIKLGVFAGFTGKSFHTLNDHTKSLPEKFADSIMIGALGGLCLGIFSPIIIPAGILFTPFAIHHLYIKNKYVFINKNELFINKKYYH
jgi:hypothetical protein